MKDTQTCPQCGSTALNVDLRDSDSPNPPRNSYGSWIVCTDCGKEWPDPMEADERIRDMPFDYEFLDPDRPDVLYPDELSPEARAEAQPELDKLDAEVERLRAEQKREGLELHRTAIIPGETEGERGPTKKKVSIEALVRKHRKLIDFLSKR